MADIQTTSTAAKSTGGSPTHAVRTGLGYLPWVAAATDTLIILVTGIVAVTSRTETPTLERATDVSDTAVAAVILGVWLGAIALNSGYRRDVFGVSTDEYKRILNAALLTAGLVGMLSYLGSYPLSRTFFLLFFTIGAPSLLLGRLVLRRLIHAARRRGVAVQRVVIAGSVSHADEVGAVLRRQPSLGYDVVGVLTPADEVLEETALGIPVLGRVEELTALATSVQADVIVFAGGALGSAQELREILWDLEQRDFHVVVAPSVSEISGDRITVRPVGGLPFIHIDPPAWIKAARIGKRLFDLVGAVALIVALSPLLALSAIRIKAHDHGPVLFRQTRIGKNGLEFGCFKFRTMVVNAEDLLAELQAHQEFAGGLFKMPDDPRITSPGHWLRRFSLDELPQLLNVVRGEMSLVGPRPPLPSEVQAYEDRTSRRLRVRPGMTGLWQVSGRSDLSWEESIRLDLYYVDNWSMMQDLSILMRTVGAVLSSRGAY